MKRRIFLASGAALALMPASAFALTTGEARVLVDKVVTDINQVIASGKSVSRMVRDFEGIFQRHADVAWIAGSALGPDARRMSASQRSQYVSAFTKYISGKYGRRFNEFKGGQIVVQNAKKEKNYFRVETLADLPGQAPFAVDFLVSNRTGKNLFFDLIVEGISLRLSEKSEIGAMLDKRGGDLDALIADLRKFG